MAQDPEHLRLIALVENLKRELGRRAPRPKKEEQGKEVAQEATSTDT